MGEGRIDASVDACPHRIPRLLTKSENLLLKIRIRLAFRRFKRLPGVVRLSPSTVLKCHRHIHMKEILTMDYVRAHTSIPVPKVHDVFVAFEDNSLCFTMEYIDAPELLTLWPEMSHAQRVDIIIQLKGYLSELRKLPPPQPGIVAAVDGSEFTDLRANIHQPGPFASMSAFHTAIGMDYIHDPSRVGDLDSSTLEALNRCVDNTRANAYRSVFTHGDIAPRNILVDKKTNKIVALIDWESSGWCPEYWEYTQVFLCNLIVKDFWKVFDEVGGLEKAYADELEVIRYLSDLFTWV